MTLLLGAIADDFTGATDLANTLVKEGMRAVQAIGVPKAGLDLGETEAVVVALKSRTTPMQEAVADSLRALDWLRGQGARQFFFKYCSTFDSTPRGNIGPVADALLGSLRGDFAVVCPAFPDNGRTIVDGKLWVNGQLLEDSPMKNHPLTPMRDSSLVKLMAEQSTRKVGLIGHDKVAKGPDALTEAFHALKAAGYSYAVVDAIENEDLLVIGRAAAGHKLITGGSGVALGLPQNFRDSGRMRTASPIGYPDAKGRSVVLAGSCSQATRAQIVHAKARWPALKLDIERIAGGEPVAAEALNWVAAQSEAAPVLIYGSADPAEVAAAQEKFGRDWAGAMMEQTLGAIAVGLVDAGARRMIVAGGETAGAVVSALGVEGLRIGPEIDPGSPGRKRWATRGWPLPSSPATSVRKISSRRPWRDCRRDGRFRTIPQRSAFRGRAVVPEHGSGRGKVATKRPPVRPFGLYHWLPSGVASTVYVHTSAAAA